MSSKHPLLDSCDPQTCTAAKIARAHRTIQSVYRKHLLGFGISNAQLSMLFVLAKKDGLRSIEMCRILALEKSSLSRNLKRLISSDFIFKTSKGELRITEAGKSKLETVIPSWEKAKSEIAIILGTRGQHALDLIINHIAKP